MKKSYWILSSIIILFVTFISISQITGLFPLRIHNLEEIATVLILVCGFISCSVGIILKKQWSPIFMSTLLLWLIPAFLRNYNASSGVRIEISVIILIIILFNFVIHRQIKIHNENKNMRKLFKIPLIILGILYVLFILFVSIPHILNIFANDIPNVDETGLRITNPNLPDSKNAYYDLNQLTGVIYLPTDKNDSNTIGNILNATSSDIWNDNLVRDVISKNSKVLEIMSSASEKSALYDLRYSDISKNSTDMVLTYLNDWRNAGKITSLNALYLLKQGKNAEAMDESIKTIKVGYLMSESNQPLIGYLVGLAVKGLGYNVATKIISQSHFSNEQKQNYLAQINALTDDGQGLRNSFVVDHYSRTNELSMITNDIMSQENIPSYAINNSYYFKINETKQLDANYTLEQIKNLSISCDNLSNISSVESTKLMPSDSPIKLFFSVYFTENAVGKILHDVSLVSLSSVYGKRCEYNSKLSALTQLLNN